ncbi:MAG TPA: 50S ribosomal protein L16 [Candidatus Paceibacterota bacterium]|jgi:large subunit ribosomal protein L16|nr:50S ribosomal protein L16 [Candidatus Paceibacterota bacterium]
MLFPKKVKFRKWQKKRTKMATRVETRGTTVSFGSYALKTESLGRITSNQIEAARKAASRHLTKVGRMWIRVFPDRPFTEKAAQQPMGKGKGELQGYHVEVLPGRIIFEVDGVPEATAREALRKAGTKLPIKTRVVARA